MNQYTSVKVPHGQISVWAYNMPFNKKSDDVPVADQWKLMDDAVVFCGQTILENQTEIMDCDLWLNLGVTQTATLIRMTYNETNSIEAPPSTDGSLSFETAEKTLELIQYSNGTLFRLSELEPEFMQWTFGFDLRYYKSYQGDGQKSGAYIFRPTNNTNDSARYAERSEAFASYQGSFVKQFLLHYHDMYGKRAVVKVIAFVDRPYITYEVLLNGIP